MKTRITALLLALVLVFAITTTAFAADVESTPHLTVTAEIVAGQVEATVYLEDAQDLTNGRVCVAYDPQTATLEGAQVLLSCGASSVNEETGKASLAWVGSRLSGEKTALLKLTFRFVGGQDLTLTAAAPEAYAGDAAVEVAEGSVTVIYNPFTDIDNHWAKDDILKAYHAGLFNGVSNTTFDPQGKLNRAMFVMVLYRMAGEPEMETETAFTDVKEGQYYTKAVAWAVETGVTQGTSKTTFSPSKNITRQELVTMLYRYAEGAGRDVTKTADLSAFKDAANVADWAEAAMAWAVGEGLLKGYPGNLLMPRGTATRAEAAVILVRFAGI
ncbi:MAG: S-layer homology domain-containing protein [Faecousia sp.]